MADKGLAFGDLLRRHRLAAGMSQAELAERAGLSARGISDLERGARRAPYRDTVLRLAEALELEAADRAVLLNSIGKRLVAKDAPGGPAAESGLPVPLSSLVGRGPELLELQQRLSHTRLLTLTGPGGVGKTRLATELAAVMSTAFPGGTFFVALYPIADADLVAPTIAQSLAMRNLSGRPVVDRLKEYLHDKRVLLVLDNFEHVLDAAQVINDLLGATTAVAALVTSREPLRLRGEHEFAVPPMALPDPNRIPPLDALSEFDAIRLFVDRATAINRNFVLTPDNAREVAEICIRLDGLPLAIELASALIRYLPPRAILSRLEHRLSLLNDGPRDLPPRHKSLRATLDWSYDMLAESERWLFRRLALFVGGCTPQAATAIGRQDNTQADVLAGLGSLVAKSLLRPEESTDGEPRFRMLETLREYGLEQLESSGELSLAQRQFADYFLRLAESAAPELLGSQQVECMRRLEGEYDNFRAVLAWSRDGVVPAETGLRLVGALGSYWAWWGDIREGRAWAEVVLGLGTAEQRSLERAQALLSAGRLAVLQDDIGATRTCTQQAAALFRERGDLVGAGRALSVGAVAELAANNMAAARALLQESVPLARQVGDDWGLALGLSQLVWVTRSAGRYEEAFVLGQEALEAARAAGERATLGLSLCALAFLARSRGEDEQAATLFQETLRLCSDFGGAWRVVPRALAGVAWAAGLAGDYATSARLLGATEALFAASGQVDLAHWRVLFDADAAAARAALGDQTFGDAWSQGRDMPFDEAIACALASRAR